jgi:adenylosuccinate lyase
MIERYQHPDILQIFSDEAKYKRWTLIEQSFIWGHAQNGTIPAEVLAMATAVPPPPAERVAQLEATTNHDVIAFVLAWIELWPDPKQARWVHFGITSSDLVDTAHHEALYESLDVMLELVTRLDFALQNHVSKYSSAYRLGRTHGQWAEPTTWGHRCREFSGMLTRAEDAMLSLRPTLRVVKTPGSVGTDPYGLQNSRSSARYRTTTSQVIPRDIQVSWAMAVVQAITVCEAIAMEVRLSSRAEVAEVREGAKQSGSSAMPHKTNPILSENITGLGRVARGMLAPIMETVVLHHERDISNSSVERTAVVDLAHLGATILTRTATLMEELTVDTDQMLNNLDAARWAPYSSMMAYGLTLHGATRSYEESHRMVREAFTTGSPVGYILARTGVKGKVWHDWLLGHKNPTWMLRNDDGF